MSKLFQNKYRIPSARLQTWNYADEGMYFITICTANRERYFGEIVANKMQLTETGKIAETEWYRTVKLRPDMNLELGEFVVMPNHIHGIIMIGANQYNIPGGGDRGDGRDAMHRVSTTPATTDGKNAMHGVSTTNTTPLPNNTPANKFGPQSKNLASIIRGYKSAVTAYARKNNIVFQWQSRFYDHIIRTMDDYHRISNYIINNPAQWQDDKFHIQ